MTQKKPTISFEALLDEAESQEANNFDDLIKDNDMRQSTGFVPHSTRNRMAETFDMRRSEFQRQAGNLDKGDASPRNSLAEAFRNEQVARNTEGALSPLTMSRRGAQRVQTSQSKSPRAEMVQVSLPKFFDVKSMIDKRPKDQKTCQLCDAKFAPIKNKPMHCKRCARAICKACSDQERQLSQLDEKVYRVCDLCDTELDNPTLDKRYKEKINELSSRAQQIADQITLLDQRKHTYTEQRNNEIAQLDQEKQAKISETTDLNKNLDDMPKIKDDLKKNEDYTYQDLEEVSNREDIAQIEQNKLRAKLESRYIELRHIQDQIKQKQLQVAEV